MNLSQYSKFAVRVLPVALALALVGCDRNKATVVTVPKEGAAAPTTMTMPPGHPDTTAGIPPGMDMGMGMGMPGRPKLTYKTPEGWTEAPLGSMRVASFKIAKDGKQADMSVIPLGGPAGGVPANVNRWRGQVGLEPLAEADLKKTAETVELAGAPAELYEIAGTGAGSGDPTRVLGAIQVRDGTSWFFKLSGDDALVASQKSALQEFLKSVQFEAPAAHDHGLPPSHPPIDGMSMGTSMVPSTEPISREGQPTWNVPAGWKETSGGQFLVAKFLIAGEGSAQAAVNVSASAGDGGGFANNVNRWRQQLGMAPLADAEINQQATAMTLADGKATVVDLNAPDQGQRVIGAMVPRAGQTFFYKLAGDAKLVSSNKEAFETFVKSAKY